MYRHPTSDTSFIEHFLHPTLDKLNKKRSKVIFTGDFNYDLIKYESHKQTNDFYDLISSYSYRPYILQPSRITYKSNTLIDNIFANDLACNSEGGNIISTIADHFIQFSFCDIFGKSKKDKNKEFKMKRNYRNFKHEEYFEELNLIDWRDVLNDETDVDLCFESFFNKFESLLNIMAPFKKQTKREKRLEQRPWITKGILKSMKMRDSLYKELTKKNDNILEKRNISIRYKKYRNMIITLQRRARENYFQNYFEKNKSDIKKTWNGIRNILAINKKKSTHIDQLNYKDNILLKDKDKADALNDFFTNIGSNVEKKIPKSKSSFQVYLNDPNIQNIIHNPCDEHEIKQIIKEFAPSKASGPNSIPVNLIKSACSILAPILTHLINKSLVQGKFPNLLKLGNVCPIYKKDDVDKCENYRPISLLSNIGKLFEKVIYARISIFLDKFEILYEKQFGFRKHHSTNHALTSIVEQIRKKLDDKNYTCGVFVDMEKAFDTVNHEILITKLQYYGIRGSYNDWLRSYLTNRKQFVTLGNSASNHGKITCGVPQGSVLGPLLFLIYINDMNKAVKNSIVHHFADDTNLLCSKKNLKELRKTMNDDLSLLFEWLCANRLSLNVAKTEFIIFRPNKCPMQNFTLKLNQKTLRESSKIKYLGVLLDRNLSWSIHIMELCKKLSRAVGMLFKMRNLCTTTTLKSIYYSLFHSHLSYGISVWGLASTSLTHKVFLLQKRAVRVIAKADFLAHTDPIFHDLNILRCSDQYLLNLASLMWDYDHNLIPKSLNIWFNKKPTHSYRTRFVKKGKLTPVVYKTTLFGMNSFRYEGTKILNLLKDEALYINSISKKDFISKLKSEIIRSYSEI